MREFRREQACQAAAKVIARRGFDRTTLREVAKVAGVSTGTVNHYFSNKLDLLVATLAYVSESFTARIAETVEARPRGLSQLETYIRISLEEAHADAVGWKVWIAAMSEATRSRQVRDVIQQRREALYGLLQQVFLEIDPTVAPSNTHFIPVARELEAFVSGLGLSMITGEEDLALERSQDAAMSFAKARLQLLSETTNDGATPISARVRRSQPTRSQP